MQAAAICVRFDTADKLSDEDRKTIVDIARKALDRFQPKLEQKPEPQDGPKPDVKQKPEIENETQPKPKAEAKES